MASNIYYESDKEYYQQLSCDYYYNNRESSLDYQREKYNSLSKEEKDERAIYAKNRYNNLHEDKKNIIRAYARNKYHSMPNDKVLKHKEYQKEYRKKYREMKKSQGKLAKRAVLTP